MPEPLSVTRITACVVVAVGGEHDAALAVGVGDGVLEHVLDRFAQPPDVAEHGAGGRRDLAVELLRLFGGARAAGLERGAAQAGDIDPLALERDAAACRRWSGRARR